MLQAGIGRTELHEPREFEAAECRDVRNREPVAGHPRPLRQKTVEESGGGNHALALFGRVIGELWILEWQEPRVRVTHVVGDGREQRQFDLAVRHLDEGSLLGVDTHQVRLRIQVLEVTADGARLREEAAIVEFQHRYARDRIHGRELRAAMLTRVEVVVLSLDVRDAFLEQEHVDAARIGRADRGVQLH